MSQTSSKLIALIEHITNGSIPNEWYYAIERIKMDADHLNTMLQASDPPPIYGVNTLVGHMDNVHLSKEEINNFQDYLIANHSLGIGDYYNEFEVKCISYAKLHFYALGGSGITPALYKHLLTVMEEGSLKARIPKHSSYSSGDVIPAAHFASDLSDILKEKFNYQLQRKEGLSLINGTFIHVGLAIASYLQTQPVWALYNFNSLQYIQLLNIQTSNFSPELTTNQNDTLHIPLEWASNSIDQEGFKDIQDPVSIRTYPQVASAMLQSIRMFGHSIDEQLGRRSDNPLVVYEEKNALSQGSFLAPMISLSTSQLIEGLLLMMWQTERRIHFLLSGKIDSIPLNASTAKDPLGFIQVPKLVTAILEESRLIGGRRTFASGSSTSYGIEDLWSNGLASLDILNKLIENMNRILAIELTLFAHINHRFLQDDQFHNLFAKYIQAGPIRKQYEKIAKDNIQLKLPITYIWEPF